ncbi:hypothetical protein PMAYCL1PPCAC_04947, partial [Pristionchus mayeri]
MSFDIWSLDSFQLHPDQSLHHVECIPIISNGVQLAGHLSASTLEESKLVQSSDHNFLVFLTQCDLLARVQPVLVVMLEEGSLTLDFVDLHEVCK